MGAGRWVEQRALNSATAARKVSAKYMKLDASARWTRRFVDSRKTRAVLAVTDGSFAPINGKVV